MTKCIIKQLEAPKISITVKQYINFTAQQWEPYGRTKKPDATVNINDVQNVYSSININKSAETVCVNRKCVGM